MTAEQHRQLRRLFNYGAKAQTLKRSVIQYAPAYELVAVRFMTTGNERRAGPDALRVLAYAVKLYCIHASVDFIKDCYGLLRVEAEGRAVHGLERDAGRHFRLAQALYEHDQPSLA